MTAAETKQVAAIAAKVFVRPWTKQGFEEALPMDNVCFLLCMDGNTVAGYCGLYMAADEGEITNVAVDPSYQGQGIGHMLIQALLKEGEKKGITRYFLEVRVSNEPAIALYEKNGFTKQGIRKNFYEELHEDAYVMNKIECRENLQEIMKIDRRDTC